MAEIIRPATLGDAEFLAQIALLAARGHAGWGFYDVMLGGSDGYLLGMLQTLATAEAPSFHHHSNRLVAELDGEPAAAISGFTAGPEATSGLLLATMEALTLDGLGEMIERRRPIDTCTSEPDPGTWVMELVGTLPVYRGLGLAARLVDAVLKRGRELGHTRASVKVEIGNDAAQRIYERAGFTVVREHRHPDFEKAMRSPGMRYLERAL